MILTWIEYDHLPDLYSGLILVFGCDLMMIKKDLKRLQNVTGWNYYLVTTNIDLAMLLIPKLYLG